MMKRHWGDRREFHDGKQEMLLYQSDSGEEGDVCHRHRLHNVTFKGTLSENILLSPLFSDAAAPPACCLRWWYARAHTAAGEGNLQQRI